MRRHLTTLTVTGAALLAVAACSEPPTSQPLAADVVQACNDYNTLVNRWSTDYGAEIGAVEAASAAGDNGRRETSVAVVRELFASTASGLRERAAAVTSHADLSAAMSDAADGLDEIGGQIETYEDVQNAPELMSSGAFADGGQRVNTICAG